MSKIMAQDTCPSSATPEMFHNNNKDYRLSYDEFINKCNLKENTDNNINFDYPNVYNYDNILYLNTRGSINNSNNYWVKQSDYDNLNSLYKELKKKYEELEYKNNQKNKCRKLSLNKLDSLSGNNFSDNSL